MVDMEIVEKMDEAERKANPPITPFLKLMSGGRDGKGNWLMNLNAGAQFLAKFKARNQGDFTLNEYTLTYKGKRVALLTMTTPTDQHVRLWVESADFSNQNDLIEVLDDGTIGLEDLKTTE